MKFNKSAILALALSMSFVVTNTALASEENPDPALEKVNVVENSIGGGGKGSQELETETSKEEPTTSIIEDEEKDDNKGEPELELNEEKDQPEAQGAEQPAEDDSAKCPAPEKAIEDFSSAIDPMFKGISKKDGVYEGTYDPETREVKVKIIDGSQGAKELSGTGLATGLEKLFKENHLVKIKVGDQDERDLKQLAAAAPTSGMTVQQMFKLVFGADMVNAVNKDGNNSTLQDFVEKSVTLKLTIQEEECEPQTITYTIKGYSDTCPIPVPGEIEKEFSKKIDPMFEDIKKKDGVYEGTYDKEKREVTVTILDKEQEAAQLTGTGLATGLEKLFKENNLVKIKVGSQEERDLKALAANAPAAGMTVQQMFKLVFGADFLNEIQKDKNTGKLGDFINEEVILKLTVQKPGCSYTETLEYKIKGKGKEEAGGNDQKPNPDQKPQPNLEDKPYDKDNDRLDYDYYLPGIIGGEDESTENPAEKEETKEEKETKTEEKTKKEKEERASEKEEKVKEAKNEKKNQGSKPAKSTNPKTGVASLGYLGAISAISMAGIVASRKKENR